MPSQSNSGAVAAMVIGATVILVPTIIVVGPVLGLLGFGAAGVAAGQYQKVSRFVMHC